MVKSHDEATSLRWAWSTDRNVTGDVNLINRPSGAPCEGPVKSNMREEEERERGRRRGRRERGRRWREGGGEGEREEERERESEMQTLTSPVNVCTEWLSIATATRSRFSRVYGAMAHTVSVETVNSALSSSSMPEKILTSQS